MCDIHLYYIFTGYNKIIKIHTTEHVYCVKTIAKTFGEKILQYNPRCLRLNLQKYQNKVMYTQSILLLSTLLFLT